MAKNKRKSRITIDKLAQITQHQFLVVDKKLDSIQGNMATKDDLKHFATKEDLRGFATKEDLRGFATKEDLRGFATKEDLKTFEVRIIRAVDGVATKFDKWEKDESAHTHLHKRITDDLHIHDQRIKKLEAKV